MLPLKCVCFLPYCYCFSATVTLLHQHISKIDVVLYVMGNTPLSLFRKTVPWSGSQICEELCPSLCSYLVTVLHWPPCPSWPETMLSALGLQPPQPLIELRVPSDWTEMLTLPLGSTNFGCNYFSGHLFYNLGKGLLILSPVLGVK